MSHLVAKGGQGSVIIARDQQVNLRPVGGDPTQGVGQQVEALLDVKPSEEKQNELPLELGKFRFEGRTWGQVVAEREIDTIGDETDRRPGSEVSQVADFRTREGVQARSTTEISGLDQCQIDPLLPALMPQGPRFGHAVGGDQVWDARPSGRPCPATRVRLPESVQMHDLGRANGLFQVGLRALDRQRLEPVVRLPAARAWESRSSPRHAAGSRRRSSPGCWAPCHHRAPGPNRCRHAASHGVVPRYLLRRSFVASRRGHGFELRSGHEITSLSSWPMWCESASVREQFERNRVPPMRRERSGRGPSSPPSRPRGVPSLGDHRRDGSPSRPTGSKSSRHPLDRIGDRSFLAGPVPESGRNPREKTPTTVGHRRRPRSRPVPRAPSNWEARTPRHERTIATNGQPGETRAGEWPRRSRSSLIARSTSPAPGPSPQSTRSHALLESECRRYRANAPISRTRFLSGTNRQTVKK